MKTAEDRFWAKVKKTETCWNWTGSKSDNGYGRVLIEGRSGYAHRVAYELSTGPIPDGAVIDHRCRVRDCVNPGHLRIVTNKQNSEHRGIGKSNQSGVLGVSWFKPTKKWVARVKHYGRVYYGGYFDAIEDAEAAVIAKRNELFSHNDADRISA
jgi:hypothetical protein